MIAYLKDVEGYVLVHVENQASRETNFNRRMYKYFCRLHEKHGPYIIPIAVFSHESMTEEPDTYKIEYSFLKMLNFKYLKLHLKRERELRKLYLLWLKIMVLVWMRQGCQEVLSDDQKKGVGLANIESSLKRFSGKGLEIKSKPGEGTEVILNISIYF